MAHKKFIQAPYFADSEGRLHPKLPVPCPRSRSEGATCSVVVVGFRKRTHGPGFSLAVAFCLFHLDFFTIYPPGWVPYARAPLVRLASDGSSVVFEPEGKPWRLTIFRALADAALGVRWPEELDLGVSPGLASLHGVARTQKIHIRDSLRILGISQRTRCRQRERVAADLGVDLSLVEEAWRCSRVRPRDGPWWKERGIQGMKILEALTQNAQTNSKLMHRW